VDSGFVAATHRDFVVQTMPSSKWYFPESMSSWAADKPSNNLAKQTGPEQPAAHEVLGWQ